jgi:hypothetical protein
LEVRKKKSVDGRTIVEWEATLSTHNFKTVSVAAFKECIRAKLLVNSKTAPFYKARLFRKMKLNGYFNRKRSETRMLQRMEATLGAPGDVVIGMGDWEQYKHRKFKEPTKGKGFRETLRRGGYNVLLVDEHRTSVQCSLCQHEDATCHTFLPMSALGKKRRRPGLTEEQLSRHVHGLLPCPQCGGSATRTGPSTWRGCRGGRSLEKSVLRICDDRLARTRRGIPGSGRAPWPKPTISRCAQRQTHVSVPALEPRELLEPGRHNPLKYGGATR